jgi:hypothetical protein
VLDPVQTSTGSPANVTDVALAPIGIVGQVPLTAGSIVGPAPDWLPLEEPEDPPLEPEPLPPELLAPEFVPELPPFEEPCEPPDPPLEPLPPCEPPDPPFEPLPPCEPPEPPPDPPSVGESV